MKSAKHIYTTGKSKTMKSKQNPGKPGSKLGKRLKVKGGIVSEHFRLKKQKEWVKNHEEIQANKGNAVYRNSRD